MMATIGFVHTPYGHYFRAGAATTLGLSPAWGALCGSLRPSICNGEYMIRHAEEDPLSTYKVVVNDEEQYSIWPHDRESPSGWRDAGKSGPKQKCLDYIAQVWTDLRPLSLRRRMARGAAVS